MQFTTAVFAAVALASSALAQTAGFAIMTSPSQDQKLDAGKSYDLIWTPGTPTGAVTIQLLQGVSPSTLQVGETVAASVPSTTGKLTFTAPSTGFATYGFKITLISDPSIFQYSFPFHVVGSSSGSSSSSSSSPSSGPSSSSSSKLSSSPSASVSTSNSASVSTPVSSSISSSKASVTLTSSNCSSIYPTPKPTSHSSGISIADVGSSTLASKPTTASLSVPIGNATSTGSSTTSTAPPIISPNAAIAQVASVGLALGGMVMALVL